MLGALCDSGWSNYSIFLRPDGLVIGYFETSDLDAALTGMAASEVNTRWQAAMAEHFVTPDVPADQALQQLDEIFNLAEQTSRYSHSS